MKPLRMAYRRAQDISDFFQVYLCRDSDGTWHGFRKKPILKVLHLKDDDGNPIDCGYWSTPEDDVVAAITFKRGVAIDKRDWQHSLTTPSTQKWGKKKKNKPKDTPQPPVEKKGPIDDETAARIKELFKD